MKTKGYFKNGSLIPFFREANMVLLWYQCRNPLMEHLFYKYVNNYVGP